MDNVATPISPWRTAGSGDSPPSPSRTSRGTDRSGRTTIGGQENTISGMAALLDDILPFVAAPHLVELVVPV